MLTSAATSAIDESLGPLPPRPHTACACARVVQIDEVRSAASRIEEDESDGGSCIDDSDDPGPPWNWSLRPQTAMVWRSPATPSRESTATVRRAPRPQTAPALGKVKSPRDLMPSPLQEQLVLLRGGLRGSLFRPSFATSRAATSTPALEKDEAGKSKAIKASLPANAAKLLPKQCLFGAGVAAGPRTKSSLAPGAAMLRSHVSWISFLPLRGGVSSDKKVLPASRPVGSQAPNSVAKTEVGLAAATELSAALWVPPPQVAAGPGDEVAAQRAEVPCGGGPGHCQEEGLRQSFGAATHSQLARPPGERRRGPKYQVLPGGSRPAPAKAARGPALAPGVLAQAPCALRECLVLEFRTEPRVVPATRPLGRHADDRGRALRFRPRSRQWAAEREVLAKR